MDRIREYTQENLPIIIHVWGPKILMAAALLFVFWIASRIVRKTISAAGEKASLDYSVVRLLAMAARVTLLVAGLITALGTLGVDVSALVAGLGLTGFALGFAVKDTISNILAGVLLLVYRPFSKQDFVEVKGMSGEVTAIDLRYTTLQHAGQKILLPNSLLFTNPITIGKAESDEG
ncbi:MAG: mechanosensitive ion channel [Verrucomicrobia subdivision 3 bacterium]|nr:mechanosensitive ion channel [Limisphaerales bacterium]